MPVWSRPKFEEEFAKGQPTYEALKRALTWLPALQVKVAWAIYDRASRPSLGFNVMGRTVIDKKTGPEGAKQPMEPAQYGNAIDFVEHSNFGLNSSDGNLRDYTGFGFDPGNVGSILNFYEGRSRGNTGWHFAYNDSWVLGGIHGNVEFQIVSPRRPSNLWEGNPGFMTVTARELIGLTSFGYRIGRTAYNEVATCDEPDTAAAADFEKYLEAVSNLNSRELVIAQLAE